MQRMNTDDEDFTELSPVGSAPDSVTPLDRWKAGHLRISFPLEVAEAKRKVRLSSTTWTMK